MSTSSAIESSLPVSPPDAPRQTIQKLIVVLILAGGIAYCNSLTSPFYLDDVPWISGSDKIKDLWDYVYAMRSRPVVALTLYLNHRIHGLNPFGYHLVNIAIHLAAAVTLFGVVRRSLLLPRWKETFVASAHWLAFAIALLWCVHPLQTQAVTYVIQRGESLMGLFFLLALYCMIRGTQTDKGWRWCLLSWFCCLLGAWSKEVMVTILPVMLCYDFVFIGSWSQMLRRRGVLYLGIALIWAVPLLIAMPILTGEVAGASAGFSIPHLPPRVYLMTQSWMLLHYLRLAVLPYPQSFSYRGWPLTTEFEDFWPAGLAIGLLILLTAWLLLKRHWIGFLGAWFFGILSVTSIVPLFDVGFEHRLYLPLASICALLVGSVHYVVLKYFGSARRVVFVQFSALTVVAVILASLTMRRNEEYRSPQALWGSVLERFPVDFEAMNNLAAAELDDNKVEQAKELYRKVLEISPGYYLAEFGVGLCLCREDNLEEGVKHMAKGAQAAETTKSLADWCAFSHFRVGKVYWMLGDKERAEVHQRKAIEFSSKQEAARLALAVLMTETNRRDQAKALLESVQQDHPELIRTEKTSAEFFLHLHPNPSEFTRKEGLFHANNAAILTGYKEPAVVALLAEAYAINGKYRNAIEKLEEFLKTADTSSEFTKAQMQRMILQYQQRLKTADKK